MESVMSIKRKSYPRKKGGKRIYYQAVICLPDGKQISKSFDNRNEAVQWEMSAKLHIKDEMLSRKSPTLDEFSARWLTEYASVRKARSSVVRDEKLLRVHILPRFSGLRISNLHPAPVEQWLTDMCQVVSAKSANHALGLLKKMLSDAVRWRLIETNPVESIRPLKTSQGELKFWSVEESNRFLDYLYRFESDKYLLFMLALNTGLRRGELRALTWDCLDLERLQIAVRGSYCVYLSRVKSTKSGKSRWVPINLQLADLLTESAGLPNSQVLQGFKFDNTTKLMCRLCRLAEVPRIRFHDLRHTFASNFMMQGGTIYDLQRLLGHSSIQMTEKYSHLSPGHLNGKTDILKFGRDEGRSGQIAGQVRGKPSATS
jgi:integrase